MRSLFLTFILGLTLIVNSAKAQDTLKIKQTAQLMLNAFTRQDYNTLMDYTYPKVVNMGGGEEKMKIIVENAMNDLKAKGFTFRSVTLGPISKIYKAGTELHCVITQYLALNVKGGYLTSISPLMCISSDQGESWKFISAGDLNEEKIKMLFPDYNPQLVLKNDSAPIFHAE